MARGWTKYSQRKLTGSSAKAHTGANRPKRSARLLLLFKIGECIGIENRTVGQETLTHRRIRQFLRGCLFVDRQTRRGGCSLAEFHVDRLHADGAVSHMTAGQAHGDEKIGALF